MVNLSLTTLICLSYPVGDSSPSFMATNSSFLFPAVVSNPIAVPREAASMTLAAAVAALTAPDAVFFVDATEDADASSVEELMEEFLLRGADSNFGSDSKSVQEEVEVEGGRDRGGGACLRPDSNIFLISDMEEGVAVVAAEAAVVSEMILWSVGERDEEDVEEKLPSSLSLSSICSSCIVLLLSTPPLAPSPPPSLFS